MSGHTQGPWEIRIERGIHCIRPSNPDQPGYTGGYAPIAKVCGDARLNNNEADARRIVACINACEGLSTEALESLGTLDRASVSRDVEITMLRQQRDQLLEALQSLMSIDVHSSITPEEADTIEAKARTAIAKATEK